MGVLNKKSIDLPPNADRSDWVLFVGIAVFVAVCLTWFVMGFVKE